MTEVYWGCLIFGVLFALITIIAGDFLSEAFDGIFDFLSGDGPFSAITQPMILVGFITTFGGAGLIFDKFLDSNLWVILLSIGTGIFVSILTYFFYVKPMDNAENSTGYSSSDLVGKLGEVTIPIPMDGFGEVMIQIGGSNSIHIAQSFDQVEIPSGEKILVIEAKDGTLFVSKYNNEL